MHSARRRLLLKLPLLFPALGLAWPAQAANELLAILGGDSEGQRRILQALNRRYPGLQASTNAAALASRKGSGTYLAIGPSALRSALGAELNGPLISLFTARQTYAKILAATPRSRTRFPITAIFSEASPAHQLRLIARLYERHVTVGILLSDSTADLEPMLRQAARDEGLELRVELSSPDGNVLRTLTRLSSATAILAVPDGEIYTADNLRGILESTYRRNQPVVGFSTSMVNAGMLATAYASIDDTIAHLGDVIEQLASGRNPEPQYPKYWRVAFNDNVARSLNIAVSSDTRAIGQLPPGRPQ